MTRTLRRLTVVVFALLLALGHARNAAAATSITLQWDANPEPDITGYIVSYGTRSGVYDHQINVGKTTTTSIPLSAIGTYYFVVSAYSPQGTSDPSSEVWTTISGTSPFIDLDTPREGYVVTSTFEVGGWALDTGAGSGTGVDAVVFYVFPNSAGPGVYIGQGSYGWSRPDVAGFFGSSQFTNSGFHFSITGLGPGSYLLGAYARSTVAGGFTAVKTVHFTVNATALMAISPPVAEATIAGPVFDVDGWSIDRSIESTAIPGSGVDTLHVYAYPNPGSGAPPIFLGVATVGLSRPDVAGFYGSRYGTSGYHLSVDRAALGLANGPYNIVVHSHSTVTGTFNNGAIVRVILQ
jgi:Fibronectin type III domain